MYVKIPNLPQNDVTAMLLSPQYEEVLRDLRSLGIELILTESCDDVQPSVSFHADILCHHIGEENILIYPYSYGLKESLLNLEMKVWQVERQLSRQYPHDVLLNAARVGEKLFCNKKYTDEAILSSVTYENIIDIPQGYAKCSTLVVDENSIITADTSISKAATQNGIDTLLISEGGIRLDGYNYGFIGGAATKLSKDKVYFTGRLSPHRDADKIRGFLHKRDIKIIEGSYDSLIDIGSMIPLLEND